MTAMEPATRARALSARHRHADAERLLGSVIETEFPGRVALVSSFGAESAVLLHLTAGIDRSLPVLFLDTGKLFGETIRYYEQLVARLGLRDVRRLTPDPVAVQATDPAGTLWARDPDRCCQVRKVAPLSRALDGFEAWITGRKRFQAGARAGLAVFEANDDRIKINPLADWSRDDIDAYFDLHDLPHHPLEADGYLSIGCLPCTDRVAPSDDPRAGRWRGTAKTECGIHLPLSTA